MASDVFDKGLIRRRLARWRASARWADFLVRHASEELADRVAAANRPFSRGADVGSLHGTMAELLRRARPQLQVVSLSPVAALASGCPAPVAVASEEALPLKEGAFDLVTSALVLQFANDLPGALVQVRRALKPDGLFVGALLGGDTLAELRQAFTIAEAEVLDGVSPRVFPTAQVQDLGALLQRAGFALPVVDSEVLTVMYPSALALMNDIRAMGAANPLLGRSRSPLRRDVLARAVEVYTQLFTAKSKVKATFEILYLCGWAPHESQQKPLKPGSASISLATVLERRVGTAGGAASPSPRAAAS